MALLMLMLFSFLFSGCATARGQHQLWDTARMSPAAGPQRPEMVVVYPEGKTPELGCLGVAMLAAHGNAYALRHTLEKTLQEQAVQVGAESLTITGSHVSNEVSVGTQGGGIAMGDTIPYPSLYAIACRTPTATTGLLFRQNRKEYVVSSVKRGSPAEAAGIVEGDTLLTVNGQLLSDDPLAYDKEIKTRQPGWKIGLEVLHERKKRTVTLTAASPQQVWGVEPVQPVQ